MKNIKASMAGNVWKIVVSEGEVINEGQEVAILESMKMEIPIETPSKGVVQEIRVAEGDFVDEGTVIVVLE